jgi:hypothetical protein
MQNQAAERRLDVAGGAAKTIVEVEMPESRLKVVTPKQTDHPAPEPDALGIAGRSAERMLSFRIFVDLLRTTGGIRAGRRRLVRGLGIDTLGKSWGT